MSLFEASILMPQTYNLSCTPTKRTWQTKFIRYYGHVMSAATQTAKGAFSYLKGL